MKINEKNILKEGRRVTSRVRRKKIDMKIYEDNKLWSKCGYGLFK